MAKQKRKFVPASEKAKVPTPKRQKFAPKNWDEVETEGVKKVHVFDTKKSKAAKKYAAPSTHPLFIAIWNESISDVVGRDNFKPPHLRQLMRLCDCHLEYEKLKEFLRVEGYSYWSDGGRNGPQKKIQPEVMQLNRCRAEMRNLEKSLGLLLVKDKDFGGGEDPPEGDGEHGEWG